MPGPSLTTAAVAAFAQRLSELDRHLDDAARVDRIRALEVLKAAAAAAQAVDAADLDASQREEQRAAGVVGWRAEVLRGPAVRRHTVRTTTPTGHSYDSQAPPVTGSGVDGMDGVTGPSRVAGGDAGARSGGSPLEEWLHQLVALGA